MGRAARLGVMGGTFDPIHYGHLLAANEAGRALDLDEVVFVPAGRPWQKAGRCLAPAEDRYQMTALATATNPLFSVSRAEIDRSGPTYTVDTLAGLRAKRGPDAELYFVIGADALSGLRTWREPDRVAALAHLVGCTRPGHEFVNPGLRDGQFTLVEIPALEISSSLCRERLRAGLGVTYLVPDVVIQYIAKRGLYRAEG